jgi:hypothetical protein
MAFFDTVTLSALPTRLATPAVLLAALRPRRTLSAELSAGPRSLKMKSTALSPTARPAAPTSSPSTMAARRTRTVPIGIRQGS